MHAVSSAGLKILMCGENAMVPELGASKVLLGVAEGLRAAGHTCVLHGPDAVGMAYVNGVKAQREYAQRLEKHLRQEAGGYDVVDYTCSYLPARRSLFPPDVLFVARSVLLPQHETKRPLPRPRTFRSLVGRVLYAHARRRAFDESIARADATVSNADLVNVSNHDDERVLIERGIDPGKIVVLPFGMHASQRRQFAHAAASAAPTQPRIAFVGSFDYRKGALDFPKIVGRIVEAVPDAHFSLLGTAGLFSTAQQVLSFFPRRVHERLLVRPYFHATELPALLAGCSIGVFPSYLEGFGFGILEMLAAGLPVVAYDCPGPSMMLEPRWLVAPGDIEAMASKVTTLLHDRAALADASGQARTNAARFDWAAIARRTADVYNERLERLRPAAMHR